jgi:hypothetical protein
MAIEQPRYTVERRFRDFEIRRYAPFVVAETVVEGRRIPAGNEGFRRLAGYIFGRNRGRRKMAMTAPVTEVPASRIAMAAPVTETPAGDVPGRFVIQFMMPSDDTLDTLPEPLDERIRLRRIPGRRVAARRYGGTWSDRRYARHLATLRRAMALEGLEPAGAPQWARYDPPFKPFFLRTNEILIDLDTAPDRLDSPRRDVYARSP